MHIHPYIHMYERLWAIHVQAGVLEATAFSDILCFGVPRCCTASNHTLAQLRSSGAFAAQICLSSSEWQDSWPLTSCSKDILFWNWGHLTILCRWESIVRFCKPRRAILSCPSLHECVRRNVCVCVCVSVGGSAAQTEETFSRGSGVQRVKGVAGRGWGAGVT